MLKWSYLTVKGIEITIIFAINQAECEQDLKRDFTENPNWKQ